MNNVFFIDADTKECFDSYYMPNPWKFEVGQKFEGFWGYDSLVTKVDLSMSYDGIEGLQVVQQVTVKRTLISF